MTDSTIPAAVTDNTGVTTSVEASIVTRDIKELLQGVEDVLAVLFQGDTTRDEKAAKLDAWILERVQAFVHEELGHESGALSAVEQTIFDALKGKIEEVLHQYILDLLERLGF